ncbi:hypothetical protein [Moraxella lacunata]|uniref:hypothetical protein n=1 Tax=Moraxella lacunata TaxID=477 RepID=UPI003EE0E709
MHHDRNLPTYQNLHPNRRQPSRKPHGHATNAIPCLCQTQLPIPAHQIAPSIGQIPCHDVHRSGQTKKSRHQQSSHHRA